MVLIVQISHIFMVTHRDTPGPMDIGLLVLMDVGWVSENEMY